MQSPGLCKKLKPLAVNVSCTIAEEVAVVGTALNNEGLAPGTRFSIGAIKRGECPIDEAPLTMPRMISIDLCTIFGVKGIFGGLSTLKVKADGGLSKSNDGTEFAPSSRNSQRLLIPSQIVITGSGI